MSRGETAETDYVADVVRLDDHARELPVTMVLTKRLVRNYAMIAYRAGRAEFVDPEPRVRPCAICGGIRQCDWDIHLELM